MLRCILKTTGKEQAIRYSILDTFEKTQPCPRHIFIYHVSAYLTTQAERMVFYTTQNYLEKERGIRRIGIWENCSSSNYHCLSPIVKELPTTQSCKQRTFALKSSVFFVLEVPTCTFWNCAMYICICLKNFIVFVISELPTGLLTELKLPLVTWLDFFFSPNMLSL